MRPVARIVTRQVRPDGGLCIFEVNARVGADLACDVPRRRAAVFFEKLESLGDPMQPMRLGRALGEWWQRIEDAQREQRDQARAVRRQLVHGVPRKRRRDGLLNTGAVGGEVCFAHHAALAA